MEGYSQHWMCVKTEQILKSHLEAPVGDDSNNYSWEERAFAEDSARILGGSMWPPRSYSCTFCKRDFRSAQALGGHMNIHRRDRARLKQNVSPRNYEPCHHHHHTKLDCGPSAYYSSSATTITATRLSCVSTHENCGQHNFSPYSSSIILGHMGSPNSEQEGVVNARNYNFNYLGCNNYVETSLSVGVTSSMFGQESSPTVPCADRANISCKRRKTLFHKPCSNDKRLALQPAAIPLGLNQGMEDLDLELRLGKQQNVK